MDDLEAIRIIEEDENADEETTLAAWQQLVNSGLVWRLQGFYGRGASRLLEAGLIHDPRHAEELPKS